jgi:hypothetical protein
MSLAVTGGSDNKIHVLFADSSGGKSIFDNIKAILQQHGNDNIIYHNLSIKQQYNGYDCGPYTAENLKLFASINPAEMNDSEIQEKMLTGVLTETRQAHRQFLYERDNGIDFDSSTNPSPGAKGGSNFDGDYNDYPQKQYFREAQENINLQQDELNLDLADWSFSEALGELEDSELN